MNARGLSRCQRQLLEKLGEQYCINRIDGANCIYRDFGDHDVEICGGRTIRAPFHIFVWQKKPHLEIIERFMDLPHDCKQIAVLLQKIAQRYPAAQAGTGIYRNRPGTGHVGEYCQIFLPTQWDKAYR